MKTRHQLNQGFDWWAFEVGMDIVADLAQTDPDTAAYLQTLLDKRKREEQDDGT